ncbi:MAG: DoxX family protein [Deltaproteobacteria bacterium]|nr:DoxX family protein [Deltaproteobacteria bacterium]
MKMNEPIGNPIYAPFFVRVSLGIYFVLAGFSKLENIPGFVHEVQGHHILPEHAATLYAILLPYAEMATGSLLVVGIWTTLAAMLSSLMLVSFVYAFGIFPGGSHLFNKDILLLGGSLSLLWSGAGALSIDRFRKTG